MAESLPCITTLMLRSRHTSSRLFHKVSSPIFLVQVLKSLPEFFKRYAVVNGSCCEGTIEYTLLDSVVHRVDYIKDVGLIASKTSALLADIPNAAIGVSSELG